MDINAKCAENTNSPFGATGFIAKDFTGLPPGSTPVLTPLDAAQVMDYAAEAAVHGKSVCIYALGPCVFTRNMERVS